MSSHITFESDCIHFFGIKWLFDSPVCSDSSFKIANFILKEDGLLQGNPIWMLKAADALAKHPHPRLNQAGYKVVQSSKYNVWLNRLPSESRLLVADKYYHPGRYLALGFDEVAGRSSFPWEIAAGQESLTLRGIQCGLGSCERAFTGFTQLTSLSTLLFYEFDNGSIPVSIQADLIKISTLRELVFRNVPLAKVPDCLVDMAGLVKLSLESNGLKELGNHFHSNLQELKVYNPIEKFIAPINVDAISMNSAMLRAQGIEFLNAKVLTLQGELESKPDITPLSSLRDLNIESVESASLSFLRGLETLHNLSLSACFLSEVVFLSQLKVLELGWDVQKNGQPVCIDSLSCLKFLESLTINFPITGIPELSPEHFHTLCLRKEVVGPANPLIARCAKVNLLTRMILRNTLPNQSILFEEWLAQPYLGPNIISKVPISFCGQTHFPYPTPMEFLDLGVQKSLFDNFNLKNVKFVDYKLELADHVGDSFRFNVRIDVPCELYNQFFITFFLSYAHSVEAGEGFEKEALKVLTGLFELHHDLFKLDSTKYGTDFKDAFLKGKCCYSLCQMADTQIDIKSAWLPKKQDGTNPVHHSKVNRSVKLHKQGIF